MTRQLYQDRARPSRPGRGFTLIEILVSLAIGMSMVSVAWASLAQIQRTTANIRAKVNLHHEAGALHTTLREQFTTVFNGGQFRIQVANSGAADASVTIDTLCGLTDTMADFGRDPTQTTRKSDIAWRRLRWSRSTSRLETAISPSEWSRTHRGNIMRQSDITMGPDPYDDDLDDDGDDDVPTWDANNDGNATNDVREVPLWVNEDIVAVGSSSSSSDHRTMLIGPEMRRDRRRHMDDNDLRLVPGITLATWQNYTNNSSGSRIPTGDDEVLDRRLGLISDRITALRLEIIDYRGMVTRINVDAAAWPAPAPADGISYVLGGVAYTPPAPVAGQPDIWNASTRIIDGTWADGRNVPCPAYPTANLPNPALERPALIRVAFTLTDRVRNLSREFSFSFAPTAIQVQP